MIGNLSRRERMIIAGAVVVGVLVGGWLFVIDPIRERNATTAELVPVREDVLGRRRDLVARKGAITNELLAANDRIEKLSTRFLTAATPAVAASELQNIAKEMASAAKTETRSERILTPIDRGELLEIPIEIAVSGEIRHLVDLLTRIENAPKLLRVQDLKVRVMNVAQPKELLATITLSGIIRPAKPKA
jgi:type II secretory pathway component PulM